MQTSLEISQFIKSILPYHYLIFFFNTMEGVQHRNFQSCAYIIKGNLSPFSFKELSRPCECSNREERFEHVHFETLFVQAVWKHRIFEEKVRIQEFTFICESLYIAYIFLPHVSRHIKYGSCSNNFFSRDF